METEKFKTIQSINKEQEDIINNILFLHSPNKRIDVDVTYSKGVFYKSGKVAQPTHKFDLTPQTEDTIQADSRCLPLDDDSVETIMFDPPFIIAGESYKNNTDSNSSKIAKRFSAYKNFEELKEHYYNSLKEFYRVLKKGGIVIFKCQNTVSGGKQLFSHYFILKSALEIGFYPKDEFVLLSKSKMTSFGGRWKRQQHAMKHHSYFLVLKKENCKVDYDFNFPPFRGSLGLEIADVSNYNKETLNPNKMYNLRLKVEKVFDKGVEIVEFNKIFEREVEKVIFEAKQKVKSEGDIRSCERIMEDAKKLTRGEIAIGCGQRYSLVIEQI
nr:MAG TPA: adenine-specific methyltransferase [Caudoviricetes sp.]